MPCVAGAIALCAARGGPESDLGIRGTLSMAAVRRMCFTTRMRPWITAPIMLAMLIAMSVLGGCERPTSDPGTLRAIRAEALAMRKTFPPQEPRNWRDVQPGQWPSVIASLRPHSVTIYEWGVDIRIKAGFDGGWGYAVPQRKSDLPMPAACYSEHGQGVFWYGPC